MHHQNRLPCAAIDVMDSVAIYSDEATCRRQRALCLACQCTGGPGEISGHHEHCHNEGNDETDDDIKHDPSFPVANGAGNLDHALTMTTLLAASSSVMPRNQCCRSAPWPTSSPPQ